MITNVTTYRRQCSDPLLMLLRRRQLLIILAVMTLGEKEHPAHQIGSGHARCTVTLTIATGRLHLRVSILTVSGQRYVVWK